MQNSSIKEVLELTKPTKNVKAKKRLLELAENFNEISGSDRPLIPDFYDCGTTARAIFIHLITVNKTQPFLQYEINQISNDYKPNTESNLKKLEKAQNILHGMHNGIMIMTLRFWYQTIDTYDERGPSKNLKNSKQFGHVWVIEKKEGYYYIYQSCLNEYTIHDHVYQNGVILNESGPMFLEQLKPLIRTRVWSDYNNELFQRYFCFTPNVAIGLNVRPEFFYAYIEY